MGWEPLRQLAGGLEACHLTALCSQRTADSALPLSSTGPTLMHPPRCSLAGRGLPELRQFLLDRATPGEWTLEAGQATDRGEDEQASRQHWGSCLWLPWEPGLPAAHRGVCCCLPDTLGQQLVILRLCSQVRTSPSRPAGARGGAGAAVPPAVC